jgi:hypothetical protein
LHQCVSSPMRVLTRARRRLHRAPVVPDLRCRTCAAPAAVAVDEWLGDVRVTCTRCGTAPSGRATRQLIRACMASLAAAQDG